MEHEHTPVVVFENEQRLIKCEECDEILGEYGAPTP